MLSLLLGVGAAIASGIGVTEAVIIGATVGAATALGATALKEKAKCNDQDVIEEAKVLMVQFLCGFAIGAITMLGIKRLKRKRNVKAKDKDSSGSGGGGDEKSLWVKNEQSKEAI